MCSSDAANLGGQAGPSKVQEGVVIGAGVDQGAIIGAGVDWDAVIGAGAC